MLDNLNFIMHDYRGHCFANILVPFPKQKQAPQDQEFQHGPGSDNRAWAYERWVMNWLIKMKFKDL